MEQLTLSPQETTSLRSPEATKNQEPVQTGDIVSFPNTLLSPRESQVLSLVAKGYTTEEVGRELDLTPKSVEGDRSSIIRKFDSSYLVDAVAKATQHEVIEPPREVHPPLNYLSNREAEILKLLTTGLTSKEIAQSLGLTAKTVENHRANTLSKLGASSSAQAVMIGLVYGIIDGSSITPPPFPEPPKEKKLTLSPRRQQILKLAAQGASTKHIANIMSIATKTVDTHLEYIRKHYNARTTTEALVRSLINNDLSIDEVAHNLGIERRQREDTETDIQLSRPLEVLQLAAIGYSAKEIANILGLAQKTVENHSSRALRLLNAVNMHMAVMKAISLGILSLDQLKTAMENGVVENRPNELPDNTIFDNSRLSTLAAD